jgi:hypothetical protein
MVPKSDQLLYEGTLYRKPGPNECFRLINVGCLCGSRWLTDDLPHWFYKPAKRISWYVSAGEIKYHSAAMANRSPNSVKVVH